MAHERGKSPNSETSPEAVEKHHYSTPQAEDNLTHEPLWAQQELSPASDPVSAHQLRVQAAFADSQPGSNAEQRAEDTSSKDEASSPQWLVDDDASVAPGQMHKSEFLDQLESSICTMTERLLADTVWSAEGCPYIGYWFGYYRGRSTAHLLRAIPLFVPEARTATTAQDLIPILTERVRQGVSNWLETGEITGVPEGVPLIVPGDSGASAPTQTESTTPPQLKKQPGLSGAAGGTPQTLQGQLGVGQPLVGPTRTRMESAFGTSFSDVRLHTDVPAASLADRLGARAFTVGRDVAFAANEYQPGTPIGDALLAHELVHVLQQRGADDVLTPQAHGSSDYNALEDDADRSALQAVLALWQGTRTIAARAIPSLRSGLRLQRCSEYEAPQVIEVPLGEAAPHGIAIGLEPDPSPGVVGMESGLFLIQGEDTVRAADSPYPMVKKWGATSPSGEYTRIATGAEAHVEFDEAGDWIIGAEIGWDAEHTYRVAKAKTIITPEKMAQEELAKLPQLNYVKFRAGLELRHLKLAEGGVKDQNFGSVPYISTTGANPAGTTYNRATYTVHPTSQAKKFRWYVRCKDWSHMAMTNFHGYRRVTIDGENAYDLMSSGTTARWIMAQPNVYTIVCEELDADGKSLGTVARYVQVVQAKEEREAVQKWRTFMSNVETDIAKITEGKEVGIRAMYIGVQDGVKMPLAMFIGPDASDGDNIKLLDLTPGAPRREYDGSTVDAALSDFDSGNSYPKGVIEIEIPRNDAGIAQKTRRFQTTGESSARAWSGGFGWASLGLAAAGVVALFLPIPGSRVAAGYLFVGAAGTGVVAGGLSLYDRLQQAEVSSSGVAIDVLGIASSIFGGAAAFRAIRQGGSVLLASRGGRFLLWAGFVSDAASGVLIAVEGFEQINQILDSKQLSRSQKIDAIVRVLANLAITGGLLALSVADLKDARSRLSGLIGKETTKKLGDDMLHTLNLLDDEALRTLGTVPYDELTDIVRVIRQDPDNAARLLQKAPIRSANELQQALRRAQTRVTEPVPGLYDAIDISQPPKDWTFKDRIVTRRGKKEIETTVTYTDANGNKKSGLFTRTFDPATNSFVMDMAFLQDLPAWVENVSVPLVPGKGIPTVTYLTIYQMKKLGVVAGDIQTVKMSTVINEETIAHLAWLRKKYPSKTADELIEYTHSPTYAETPIIQSGYQIVPGSYRVSGGIQEPLRSAVSDASILKKYGFTPSDLNQDVLSAFDIYFNVTPVKAGAGGATPSGPGPGGTPPSTPSGGTP